MTEGNISTSASEPTLRRSVYDMCKRQSKRSQNFFFQIGGLLYHEFVPPGQIVIGHFYVHVLRKLRYAVAGTMVSAAP
jgi:hypothetical protein